MYKRGTNREQGPPTPKKPAPPGGFGAPLPYKNIKIGYIAYCHATDKKEENAPLSHRKHLMPECPICTAEYSGNTPTCPVCRSKARNIVVEPPKKNSSCRTKKWRARNREKSRTYMRQYMQKYRMKDKEVSK